MTRKQKKQMKKAIRKELASNDHMPIEEVGRISDIWRLLQKDKWRFSVLT
jgi:hypothetical protein